MRRIAVFIVSTAVLVLAGATNAWAHVTVSPTEAPKGGFATLTFQVPNEEADATTNKVVVNFPPEAPIADASIEPIPGWSAEVATTKLTTPITTDEGESLNEAVKSITWTATDGKGLGEGQFQQFKVSVGLPDADSLQFDADQYYSNGQVVHWNQQTPPGGPEPDHPAPTVTLVAGSGEGGATPTTVGTGTAAAASNVKKSDVDTAKTMSIVALVVGIVGLLVGIAAFVMKGRRTT